MRKSLAAAAVGFTSLGGAAADGTLLAYEPFNTPTTSFTATPSAGAPAALATTGSVGFTGEWAVGAGLATRYRGQWAVTAPGYDETTRPSVLDSSASGFANDHKFTAGPKSPLPTETSSQSPNFGNPVTTQQTFTSRTLSPTLGYIDGSPPVATTWMSIVMSSLDASEPGDTEPASGGGTTSLYQQGKTVVELKQAGLTWLVLGNQGGDRALPGEPGLAPTGTWSLKVIPFHGGNDASQAATLDAAADGIADHLVLRMDMRGSGQSDYYLWINPTPSDLADAGTADVAVQAGPFAFDTVQFISAGQKVTSSFDEVRFGTEAGDVAVIPEPVSAAMLAGVGMMLFRRNL